MTRLLRHTTIFLAALAAALAVAPAGSSAPDVLRTPTENCWRDVINDWIDNSRIDRVYALPCYAEAVQRLNEYPDVKGYSSAIDDIRSAQLAAIHSERGGFGGGTGFGPGGPGGPGDGGSSGGAGGTAAGPAGSPGASGGPGFLGAFGASDAQSVPLPLLVLGGLAILLALAALAAWLARRYQGRRPAPAPAVSRRR